MQDIACILPLFMEPTTAPTPLPRKLRFKIILENALYVVAAIILASLIQAFVARPFIVSGNSMDPSITNRAYLIIDQITYRASAPERGDVIVFKAPPDPSKYYIKRIIGLPGETVVINESEVRIINNEYPDGFILEEPYITHAGNDRLRVVVPEGRYFVMGDNRSGSYDSRAWGSLPKSEIEGRVLVRLLPLKKIGIFPAAHIYSYEKTN